MTDAQAAGPNILSMEVPSNLIKRSYDLAIWICCLKLVLVSK
jgi:hypothetical protein